jgi:3-oxoacyl-[acyl-carrier-protein] synthase II
VPIESKGSLPRVSQLSLLAAQQAIGSCDLGTNDEATGTLGSVPLQDTALVVGTSKGPIESWLAPPSRLSDVEGPIPLGLAQTACDLAGALGIGGPRLTTSAACASGLHALIRGTMLIESGEARRVLVVAAEASVHPLFLASFKRLGVLPPENIGCRPFDELRSGFLMSEAAAAVVLEAEAESAGAIAIDRYAIGADATHLTGSDPEGRTLRAVLAKAIDGRKVDLVHAHGTGTVANDSIELAAIDDCVSQADWLPTLYSHKAALGHSLGAAGLVSVVLNVLSHRHGIVPPNVRTTQPLAAQHLAIPQDITPRTVRRSIAVAAGFGGAVAAVSLSTRSNAWDTNRA